MAWLHGHWNNAQKFPLQRLPADEKRTVLVQKSITRCSNDIFIDFGVQYIFQAGKHVQKDDFVNNYCIMNH